MTTAEPASEKPKTGLAAIMGQWPGDELDDEILKALAADSNSFQKQKQRDREFEQWKRRAEAAEVEIKILNQILNRLELEVREINPCPKCNYCHEMQVFPQTEVARLRDQRDAMLETLNEIAEVVGADPVNQSGDELVAKIKAFKRDKVWAEFKEIEEELLCSALVGPMDENIRDEIEKGPQPPASPPSEPKK